MREDTEFLLDALKEGVDVRRFVCIYGHSLYPPTTPEQRGWSPRPKGRRCAHCGGTLPAGSHRYLCDACIKAPPRPCSHCGRPTQRGRKTCSKACLSERSRVSGKLGVEALQALRKRSA